METVNKILIRYGVDGEENEKWVDLPFYANDLFKLMGLEWNDRNKYGREIKDNPADFDFFFEADEFPIGVEPTFCDYEVIETEFHNGKDVELGEQIDYYNLMNEDNEF